jgi:hypothetical protein
MIEHPLLHVLRPSRIFARREGCSIPVESFLADVAALSQLLPSGGHVVNLCRDRYRFAVGFAAALCRRQVNLLPPNDMPGMLDQLAVDYPDVYCLADGERADGPASFPYPLSLPHDTAAHSVPRVPDVHSHMAGVGATWSTVRSQHAGGSAFVRWKGHR